MEPKDNPILDTAVIELVTATQNREVMVLGTHGKGALVFVLQSREDDTFLNYTFDTVAKSAKTQVSRTRPALFLVGFDGLGSNELLELAKQDSDPQQSPTGLRIAVSEFLSSQDRDHVVGVAFLSRVATMPRSNGVVESGSGGTAYNFPKQDSCFWHDDFSGLFSFS